MTGHQHDRSYAAVRGIWCYVTAVATAVGLAPEATTVIVDAPDYTGYLALGACLERFPGMELLLIWDTATGWSAAVEAPDGAVVILCYLPGLLCPAPQAVSGFLQAVRAGECPGQPDAPRFDVDADWLTRRLACYAVPSRSATAHGAARCGQATSSRACAARNAGSGWAAGRRPCGRAQRTGRDGRSPSGQRRQ